MTLGKQSTKAQRFPPRTDVLEVPGDFPLAAVPDAAPPAAPAARPAASRADRARPEARWGRAGPAAEAAPAVGPAAARSEEARLAGFEDVDFKYPAIRYLECICERFG